MDNANFHYTNRIRCIASSPGRCNQHLGFPGKNNLDNYRSRLIAGRRFLFFFRLIVVTLSLLMLSLYRYFYYYWDGYYP